MSISSNFGTIITFYSWKGGVGRTMALANISVCLAQLGRNVLIVDWDLEAPGLEHYFQHPEIEGLTIKPASDPSGLLGLLQASHAQQPDPADWEQRLANISIPPAKPTYSHAIAPSPGRLDFLASGKSSSVYSQNLAEFSWDDFFANQSGGEWLEVLREQWTQKYDFVLIDARTGLTDSGGVCTVQMPDILVLVFTANEQSLQDGLKIVASAQEQRRNFAYDRAPLTVIPLLSRWCGDDEVDLAESWMKKLDVELKPLFASWLPLAFTPRQFFEKTRVPHVTRFSFGEPLPVLTHTLNDANLPGLSYLTIARLLNSQLTDAGKIIDPDYQKPIQLNAGFKEKEDLKLLALVQDSSALYQEIARISASYGAESLQLAEFLNRAGNLLYQLGRYNEVEPFYRRALAITEKKAYSEVLHLTSISNVALLLHETNRLSEAEDLMRFVIQLAEKSIGTKHTYFSTLLNNLAQLLFDNHQFVEAEQLMRQVLEIDQKNYGFEHPNTAIRNNNIAQLLQATGRFQEAEMLMRSALMIDEKFYGIDHPNVASDLNNLASLMKITNRLSEAEPLFRRALAIDESCFGAEHPHVARDLNNLAVLLQDKQHYAQAETLLRRALAIDESAFGSNHPLIANRLNNLAILLNETGRSLEAEPIMRRALEIDQQALDDYHPTLVDDLKNLALILENNNNHEEAKVLIEKARKIEEHNAKLQQSSVL